MTYAFILQLLIGAIVILAWLAIMVLVEREARRINREKRRDREAQAEALKAARVRVGLDVRA